MKSSTIIIIAILILLAIKLPKTFAQEYPALIKCYNYKTGEIHEPLNQTKEWCYLGQNWEPIYIPSDTQMNLLQKHFTKEQIINRLPILNRESRFNSKAIGKFSYGKDCWLLQIRDIYGWCKMTDEEQILWLKKRMESQYKWNCSQYRNKWEERMLRCLYSRHNGRLKAYNFYDNLLIATLKIYKEYYK